MFFYYFPHTGSIKYNSSYSGSHDISDASKNESKQFYNFLIANEIFIEQKYANQAMKEVLFIVFNEEIRTADGEYIFLPLNYKNIKEKYDLIDAQLQSLGYIRPFGAKDRGHIEQAFRIELIIQICESEVLSFKHGMYLLRLFAKIYDDLFYIEVNNGPMLKTNPIYKGFGALLNDKNMLPDDKRFEIIQEVQTYLAENNPHAIKNKINTALANEQFNDIIIKMNRENLAETRYYKGDI